MQVVASQRELKNQSRLKDGLKEREGKEIKEREGKAKRQRKRSNFSRLRNSIEDDMEKEDKGRSYLHCGSKVVYISNERLVRHQGGGVDEYGLELKKASLFLLFSCCIEIRLMNFAFLFLLL